MENKKLDDPFRRRNEFTKAIFNKLIHPTNRTISPNKLTADVPAQHDLIPLVKENMQRVMDGENVLEILPELDYVASIVISGILSTKDLITCKLNFDSLAHGINQELMADLIKELRRFFETTYPIHDYLYEILYDTMFRTGSYALGIIPESSVDRIINEGGGRIGSEAYDQDLRGAMKVRGILGNPNAVDDEATTGVGIEQFIKTARKESFNGTGYQVSLKGKVPNREVAPTKKVEGDKTITTYPDVEVDFGFTLTDNPDTIKIPQLYKARAKSVVTNTYNDLMKSNMSFGMENREGVVNAFVGLERENTVFDYFDAGAYKNRNYQSKPVEEVLPVELAGRRSLGHPMYQHFSSESFIPCHTPGTFTQLIGGFAVLDEQGYPVTRNSRMYNASATAWIMGNPSSQLINDAAMGLGINKQDDPNREWTMSKLLDSYAQLVEAKLVQSLKSGAYGGTFNIVRPQQVYQIMMARALSKKNTQILYIPAEQLVYFALDWTPDGLGRSRLDKTRMISTVRSAIALATMQSTVLNATRNIKLTVTLAPEDRDGEKTINEAVFRATQQFLSRIPYSGTPDDVMAYIANAGIDVEVEGNDFYASTKVDVTENSPDYKIPDPAIDEALLRKQARALGADPDLVINPEQIEFASQITTKNVFNTKRIVQDQQRLQPLLSHWVKIHVYSDPVIIDRLTNCVMKYLDKYAEVREEVDAQELDTETRGATADPIIEDETFALESFPGLEMFTEGTITESDLKREAVNDPNAINKFTKNRRTAIARKVLSRFVGHICVSLPPPDTGKLNSQMELFDKRMEHVDKQLEKVWADGIFDGTVYEGSEGKVRSMISSIMAYQWLSENDVDPDLMAIMAPETEELSDTVQFISTQRADMTHGVLRMVKAVESKLQTVAKNLDVETNEEAGVGDTLGGQGSSGGYDEGGDEFGGDEFGTEGDDSLDAGDGGDDLGGEAGDDGEFNFDAGGDDEINFEETGDTDTGTDGGAAGDAQSDEVDVVQGDETDTGDLGGDETMEATAPVPDETDEEEDEGKDKP